MEWTRFCDKKPNPAKPVLVAWGGHGFYYSVQIFSDNDLRNIEIHKDIGWWRGSFIFSWMEIENPIR